ncbi:hypothetical protein [Kordiimonas pumila]|uniref:Uncharacterized protein n=1 Tax=Kordiimonas pumila TaxID=2161677 RepID=A0ABV7D5R8_9PROT|nr:hypothetical protein [Kordiimonas pumila]
MQRIAQVIVMWAVFMLAGCDQAAHVPLVPQAIVGTKAVIRAHGKDLSLEVTDVAEKIVTTELSDWNGELVAQRHFYRGLYPVAGTEGTNQWELEFDHAKLESLFPLSVGKETSFTGNMRDISSGKTYEFWVNLTVAGETPFTLPDGTYTSYVVDIVTKYAWNGEMRRKNEVVYYAPEFSMNLKGVMQEATSQRYWRVISLERPGQASSRPNSGRQRSSGTVMI